jgi:hypothetical protein
MLVVKIKGSQGSWEATVSYPDKRKEVLACVHKHFWKVGPSGPCYDDPWTPELRKTSKFANHVELIRTTQRLILTTDDVDESKRRGEGYFRRTGYIGIYTIEDFVVDDSGMRFRFLERIARPK